jgi:hypothetical protein
VLAPLDELTGHRHARGAQQLAQLGEIVSLSERGHAQGALARSLRGL